MKGKDLRGALLLVPVLFWCDYYNLRLVFCSGVGAAFTFSLLRSVDMSCRPDHESMLSTCE